MDGFFYLLLRNRLLISKKSINNEEVTWLSILVKYSKYVISLNVTCMEMGITKLICALPFATNSVRI